ncbi:MAG: 4-(cytidine 5'-diphospho)-2-C-methyl-D-erythritol kinase [Spirochaetes bacterium RBG_16_49_21]|nr:MAG: 4-(cytidine 5'-diphospho)-2-C-methyl-D-erythritol kinase [Spirochaetes bacterium RBG_16_49_21]
MVNKTRAYAKVNLHLEVLGRRRDGYHDIFSLMAGVELHDLLKLESIEAYESQNDAVSVTILSGGGTQKDILDSIPVKDNLITRATVAYLETMNMSGDAVFSIRKNIPAGAGLGGGSSDAAAALKLLNGRFSRYAAYELSAVGSKIGADVAYCLQGGFAVCRGIGEIVTPLPAKFPYWVLIINDGVHINTGAAYKALNITGEVSPAREAETGKRVRQVVKALATGSIDLLREIARNDFETPAFEQYPGIGAVKERLYDLGAEFSIMTGSGSSVIALFKKKEKAVQVQDKIRRDYKEVILTRFLH